MSDKLEEWERQDLASCLERAEARWHRWRAWNQHDPLQKAMWGAMTPEQRCIAYEGSAPVLPQGSKGAEHKELGSSVRRARDFRISEILRVLDG